MTTAEALTDAIVILRRLASEECERNRAAQLHEAADIITTIRDQLNENGTLHAGQWYVYRRHLPAAPFL